jgi:metallo-beta-lactamase family protein
MLPDHKHTVIIVGFAAAGTRARQLMDGASEVKIHGRYVPVHAEVVTMNALSAHADSDELYDWATAERAPRTCYVMHGEPQSSHDLARKLHTGAGWTAVVPNPGERVLI